MTPFISLGSPVIDTWLLLKNVVRGYDSLIRDVGRSTAGSTSLWLFLAFIPRGCDAYFRFLLFDGFCFVHTTDEKANRFHHFKKPVKRALAHVACSHWLHISFDLQGAITITTQFVVNQTWKIKQEKNVKSIVLAIKATATFSTFWYNSWAKFQKCASRLQGFRIIVWN